MKFKLINEDAQKTWALIFDRGDEVSESLKTFARDQKLSASQFTAIGAFSDLVLGFFVLEAKGYERIPIREQVEVLSFLGDVSLKDGEPQIHAHVVVGKRDGSAHGGHLIEAHVNPTLEVILTESPAHLRRTIDLETELPLIDLKK